MYEAKSRTSQSHRSLTGSDLDQIFKFKVISTECCFFDNATDLKKVKAWDQVFIKLMRQYKYLKKLLADEIKKISQEHRLCLAQLTALWAVSGFILPNLLPITITVHQVKD